MNFQAHRGVSCEAPENTMSAFIAAVKQGYDVIELDPAMTKDGKFVVLHDETINRTARNIDGSFIAKEIRISDITYEEAIKYDFGVSFSSKFKGERLPLFSDAEELSARTGILLKVDSKIWGLLPSDVERFAQEIESSGAHYAVTCDNDDQVRRAVKLFSRAEIHCNGMIDRELLALVAQLRFVTVWLPLKSEQTGWVREPYASRERANEFKAYGKLGIWIIRDSEQFAQAIDLGADIIETPGQLKPNGAHGIIADSHTHTACSHDSTLDPESSCKAALVRGANSIVFSDHCDINFYGEKDVFYPIKLSHECTVAMQKVFGGKPQVYGGAEMGDGFLYSDVASKYAKEYEYDELIGSVHTMPLNGEYRVYSTFDFSTLTDAEISEALRGYFDAVLRTAEEQDIDVLAHLTCPLRYICGKYGRQVDLTVYSDVIDRILKSIIVRGIALEVNTSNIGNVRYGELMPPPDIIKRYRELGGYLITVGSDAHVAEKICNGFDEAFKTLKSLGFYRYFYYESRIARQAEL